METWPSTFIRVFLDDSLGDRTWVDKSECQPFVRNLLTAFKTEVPPSEFYISLNFGEPPPTVLVTPNTPPLAGSMEFGSPISEPRDDNSRESIELVLELSGSDEGDGGMSVRPRFEVKSQEVTEFTVQLLQDWWSRRLDITPKNLLKTMSTASGLLEVRQAAAQKLDTWLQNTKVG